MKVGRSEEGVGGEMRSEGLCANADVCLSMQVLGAEREKGEG